MPSHWTGQTGLDLIHMIQLALQFVDLSLLGLNLALLVLICVTLDTFFYFSKSSFLHYQNADGACIIGLM